MIFSSLEFVCVFLPITFLLYCILPSIKLRNGLLIAASLLFYAYGEPVFVSLMIFSALFNYFMARGIAGKKKKLLLVITLIVNFAMLGVFKYAMFFVDSMNGLFHLNISCPQIDLPIGISFFTFQVVSYVVDVYRGKVEVQKSFPKLLLYISFFPQLIAGPIVRYTDISKALDERSMNIENAAFGLRRFICGLAKKVLIANTMGSVADAIFAAQIDTVNVLGAWIGAIAYLMQIYYDFSGYSDMAIGLGRMFGFEFRENFQYPYGAASIQEFWKRWHISLSGWFKEYVYIPLGGNRKGKFRSAMNRMCVFLLTGLWHGANWTFVLWGIYHGLFLLLEEYVPFVKKLPKWLNHVYTMVVVCVGFVMFRADTVIDGFSYIGQMFTGFFNSPAAIALVCQQMTPYFIVMFLAAVIGMAPIRFLANRIRKQEENSALLTGKWKWMQKGLFTMAFLLLVWCMVRLSGSTYNPFIYFRF
ncbi:MAG: MBOAT family protein [Lachnospiraceae bacterium]|nr:MBOAT family protein [Lachnospiraceae bacterium]